MGKIKSMLMDMSIQEAEVLLKDMRKYKIDNNKKSSCIDEVSTPILNKDKRSKKCH